MRKFRATLLAHVSSRRAKADLWSELSIYRLDDGTYILHSVGKAEDPEKEPRHEFVLGSGASIDVVVSSLYRGGEVSYLGRRLVQAAQRMDAIFRGYHVQGKRIKKRRERSTETPGGGDVGEVCGSDPLARERQVPPV